MRVEQGLQAYNQEFDRRPNQSPLLIKRNLETIISERFNVLLSTTRYGIIGGNIFGEGLNEPFINSLERGRDYRKFYGKPIDRERENAEVEGFRKTEQILIDQNTPVGTMVLSFSLKGSEGSTYQHNFYDIFTKNKDGSIEARRYSSALNESDAAKFYLDLGFNGQGEVANAAFFLANPIVVNDPRFKTPEELHRYLHKEHSYTTVEEFQRIINGGRASILKYVNNPTPHNFNEALNVMDILAGLRKGDIKDPMLGFLPVREVAVGCGSSGGAYSVAEFGSHDGLGAREFPCPVCKWINRRPVNEKIALCQNPGCPDPKKVAC